jgi:hypothetical protein
LQALLSKGLTSLAKRYVSAIGTPVPIIKLSPSR